jgi:hypothetical protein
VVPYEPFGFQVPKRLIKKNPQIQLKRLIEEDSQVLLERLTGSALEEEEAMIPNWQGTESARSNPMW